MNSDTTTVQSPATSPSASPPRRPARRPVTPWILAGAGVAVVGLVLGLSGIGPSRGSADVHPQSPAAVTIPTDTGLDRPDLGRVPDEGGVVDPAGETAEADRPGPKVDQAGDTPAVEEPEPEPEAPVEALPATLAVTPDPVHLKAGVYTGSITVANVGDEPMHWSALTKPWVSLSDVTGDLGAHGENVIGFTVDESELDAGSFAFKIKVWGNGGTTYVDVTGAKPVTDII
jgi:hypothetical protein